MMICMNIYLSMWVLTPACSQASQSHKEVFVSSCRLRLSAYGGCNFSIEFSGSGWCQSYGVWTLYSMSFNWQSLRIQRPWWNGKYIWIKIAQWKCQTACTWLGKNMLTNNFDMIIIMHDIITCIMATYPVYSTRGSAVSNSFLAILVKVRLW